MWYNLSLIMDCHEGRLVVRLGSADAGAEAVVTGISKCGAEAEVTG